MNDLRRVNLVWLKSSYSGGLENNCIEIAEGLANVVPVRDSKSPNGPALMFSENGWKSFIVAIKAGEFPIV